MSTLVDGLLIMSVVGGEKNLKWVWSGLWVSGPAVEIMELCGDVSNKGFGVDCGEKVFLCGLRIEKLCCYIGSEQIRCEFEFCVLCVIVS